MRSGQPVAMIVSAPRHGPRVLGADRELFDVPDDFDAPLPDDVVDASER